MYIDTKTVRSKLHEKLRILNALESSEYVLKSLTNRKTIKIYIESRLLEIPVSDPAYSKFNELLRSICAIKIDSLKVSLDYI